MDNEKVSDTTQDVSNELKEMSSNVSDQVEEVKSEMTENLENVSDSVEETKSEVSESVSSDASEKVEQSSMVNQDNNISETNAEPQKKKSIWRWLAPLIAGVVVLAIVVGAVGVKVYQKVQREHALNSLVDTYNKQGKKLSTQTEGMIDSATAKRSGDEVDMTVKMSSKLTEILDMYNVYSSKDELASEMKKSMDSEFSSVKDDLTASERAILKNVKVKVIIEEDSGKELTSVTETIK